ncbi:hypothetical protein CKO28_07060 [Rhodovibrio sodomensis]|uniref:PepSY domain-containing protein n=1 Tax=Rhodovibrio sodomensis TaxID=1088 RepID=A0ABS1DCX9_9PROT|nr:PepSY domain-containing protein [Rhodovibrio sodomensis]MBK1667792.1 hypothetical protein [Rhodovibrio sodomensis]
MKRRTTVLIVLAVMLAGLAAAPSGHGDHERAREAVRQGEIRPLQDILERARSAFDGEMLEVELAEQRHGPFDGRQVYEVKMLAADGTVMELYYDARTGELLKARGHGLEEHERGRAADEDDGKEHDDHGDAEDDDGWGWFWD